MVASPSEWWKCDETSGTTLTDSVASKAMALAGTYTVGQTKISSNSAAGFSTNFNVGSASIASTGLAATTFAGHAFSIVGWVNCASFVNSRYLLGSHYSSNPNGTFGLVHNRDATYGNGKWGVGIYNGSVWTDAFYNTALSASTTYMLAGTWDGANLRFYVNATLQATTAFSGTWTQNATDGMTIGGNWASTTTDFVGTVDDVAIWTSALSGSDLSALYADFSAASGGGGGATPRATFHLTDALRRQAVIRAAHY